MSAHSNRIDIGNTSYTQVLPIERPYMMKATSVRWKLVAY